LNGGVEDTRGFTTSQRAGLDARSLDQDRTLTAMHQLEAALATAAPHRTTRWREGVLAGLAALDEATGDEFENSESPDSLLSDIKRTQPRLRTRVRGLRTQYVRLREAIVSLRAELDEPTDEDTDFADVRERLSWLLTALRHQRALESDLIYEAYLDAFDIDVSADEPPPRAD
jgi:hypothetical protein